MARKCTAVSWRLVARQVLLMRGAGQTGMPKVCALRCLRSKAHAEEQRLGLCLQLLADRAHEGPLRGKQKWMQELTNADWAPPSLRSGHFKSTNLSTPCTKLGGLGSMLCICFHIMAFRGTRFFYAYRKDTMAVPRQGLKRREGGVGVLRMTGKAH